MSPKVAYFVHPERDIPYRLGGGSKMKSLFGAGDTSLKEFPLVPLRNSSLKALFLGVKALFYFLLGIISVGYLSGLSFGP